LKVNLNHVNPQTHHTTQKLQFEQPTSQLWQLITGNQKEKSKTHHRKSLMKAKGLLQKESKQRIARRVTTTSHTSERLIQIRERETVKGQRLGNTIWLHQQGLPPNESNFAVIKNGKLWIKKI